jgi:hypothetical protein
MNIFFSFDKKKMRPFSTTSFLRFKNLFGGGNKISPLSQWQTNYNLAPPVLKKQEENYTIVDNFSKTILVRYSTI